MKIVKTKLKVGKINIIRLENNQREEVADFIIRESRLNIILNDKKIIHLKYSPGNEDYLGIGFLYTSGFLKKKEDIVSVVVAGGKEEDTIKITTKNISPVQEDLVKNNLISRNANLRIPKVKFKIILKLMNSLEEKAKLFKLTGGTHSCALADQQGFMIFFTEDISRYNTIDKILGEAILKNIPREDKIILTSCRITAEILTKIAVGGVPMIISRAAPTDRAVELAQKIGITLVGFVRGKRMNIYAHPERIEIKG